MKKTERKNHIKIESHASFVQESNNLLKKINDNIAELAQYGRVEMNEPSATIAEELNRLKYHRKKLNLQLDRFENAGEARWMEAKDGAQKVFDEAYAELLKASKEVSTS